MAGSVKTQKEIEQAKEQKFMNMIAFRASYYRANPQRFVSEVLGLHLKVFQQILLWAMMHYNYLMYLAARGRKYQGSPIKKLIGNNEGKIGEC